MALTQFFDKLNKIPLYLFVVLVPLFFLPFSINVLDTPKLILASVLIPLSLVGWVGKVVGEGKLSIRGNKIFYFILTLILLSILFSSIFSVLGENSFFGYSPGDVSDNFLTFLLLLILTFLLINSFRTEIEIIQLLFYFLFGVALAGLFNLLQVYRIFILPFDIAKNSSFNTIGTPNSFAVLAAVFLPISLVLAFSSKIYSKIILGIISFVLFANVALVNFRVAWLVLMVGILVLFIFGFGREKKLKFSLSILLMLGLSFSIFFYFFPITLPGFPSLIPEVLLRFNSEFLILKGVFGQGIKDLIFGTGPGTFIFDYSKYRPSILNQTVFWGTRFIKGSSAFFDWFLTKGLLGGLSLLFLYLFIIYLSGRKYLLLPKEIKLYGEIGLALFAGMLGLILASLFYPFNFTLYFSFWFLLGVLFFFIDSKTTQLNFASSWQAILANGILILTIIFTLTINFSHAKRYFAEVKYVKGIQAFRAGDVERSINFLQEATKLNPSLDIFWRDLSQIFLAKTNSIAQNPNLSVPEKGRLINLAIVNGAEAVNKAVNILPTNVANWNVRGFFYRNLIGLEGAERLSLDSYQKAIELEPSSPFAWGEKGRVYILAAQDFRQKAKPDLAKQNLNLAEENLKTAIGLKSDYAPAHYLLAIVYDQLGKVDEAITKLEETKAITPTDTGVIFQLGMLYWRKDRLDEAQQQFEEVLNINHNYANARYLLGLVYDKKGEKEKAKAEFERVADLNPQNQEVKKILDNLNQGLPALEGITPSQPPIGEIPSEIQER